MIKNDWPYREAVQTSITATYEQITAYIVSTHWWKYKLYIVACRPIAK
jgi:hypothetical protein